MSIKKTIGILGGMGPSASAMLYLDIIKYLQADYSAVQDTDYPPIIIYSLPLLGFDETGITDEELVKKQLIKGVQTLESAGVDSIIIACNTVHVFYDELQKSISIPILHIVEETAKDVINKGYKKVGIFASEYTNKLKLYCSIFNKSNIDVILPNENQQKILNKTIENVMGGTQGLKDVQSLISIAEDYKNQGAEAIILGCTEIPLAINQTDTDMPLFDTLFIIGKSAVKFSV